MNRIDFVKRSFSFLGMSLIAPALLGSGRAAAACTKAASETAGPFPTLTPASLVRNSIIGTRTGVPFTINITVKNVNNNCLALPGVIVDIWHCDKDGNYSQYGGSGMQPTNYTSQDFLRGRQTTDSTGLVSFTSIFPGWYTGRATHIHVHIYDTSGNTLVITQIAFPEGSTSAVVTVNSATSAGYTKGMSGYTYNASDNVFSDGTSTEMSTITGSVAAGYVLAWDAFVSSDAGSSTGVSTIAAESQFQVRQNFPNPVTDITKIPLVLRTAADVRVSVTSVDGKEILRQSLGNLSAGDQVVDLDLSRVPAGKYIYTVKVSNLSGSFAQSKLMIKI